MPASLEQMQVSLRPSAVNVKHLVKRTSPRRSEIDDLYVALDHVFAVSAKAGERRVIYFRLAV